MRKCLRTLVGVGLTLGSGGWPHTGSRRVLWAGSDVCSRTCFWLTSTARTPGQTWPLTVGKYRSGTWHIGSHSWHLYRKLIGRGQKWQRTRKHLGKLKGLWEWEAKWPIQYELRKPLIRFSTTHLSIYHHPSTIHPSIYQPSIHPPSIYHPFIHLLCIHPSTIQLSICHPPIHPPSSIHPPSLPLIIYHHPSIYYHRSIHPSTSI